MNSSPSASTTKPLSAARSGHERTENGLVVPYTPEWAEQETGIPATQLREFVKELAKASPSVIWHPGWMAARYKDSFYICRSIYTINALLGAYGAKGGLPFVSKPGDVGRKGLNSFMDLYPQPEEKRADGVGWRYPQFETVLACSI